MKKQTASPLQTDILPDEITLEELTDDNFDLIHPDISGQKEETKEENSGKQKPDCEDGNNKNLPLKQTQKAAENLSQVSAQERQTEAKKDTPSAFTKTENNTGRKQEETTAQTEMTVPKKTATQKKKPKKVHSASSPTLFDLMKETEKNVKPHNNNLPEEETHARLDMQGMYVPTFTSQIKENHAKPLSQKDAYYFLNLAGKTGCLFLEVFLEPGGIPVLVLYDTFRDTFFYVKNPNDYDGILLRILCHKSIRKICVNPYTLYGYTYTFSHFAKNVFSLERQKLSDTLFHTRRIKTLPASLSLMKQYPSILKQAEEIWDNKTDSLFQKKLLLDAAYGCSLMTNRFFKERLLLFNMEENEQLHFYLPKKLTPDNKGTFLGYHLTHEEDDETDLLFDDLLTFICGNGCFKNIPFQILYKDNHSILFFIEEDFKKRFDAICTIRLTELCETYSLSQALLQVDMHQSYEEAVKQVTS